MFVFDALPFANNPVIIETLRDAFGIVEVKPTTVWTPLWGPERMSEEARVALGYPI